ncbi:MAG TPA: D-serine ammonia-lyase, partial [Steroidobacteraceae bacterium]|nr:D-serine ammonia-lyase [Steroidobacteraceae bacterium]
MLAKQLRARQPLLWINPGWRSAAMALPTLPLSRSDIEGAEARLSRWAGLIAQLFPETRAARGLIESALYPAKSLPGLAPNVAGRFFIKGDHALPVAGSIKARGGLYEVFLHAEKLALEHGVLTEGAAAEGLASPDARTLFAKHEVVVGSTGNLGLSIGIAAAALGFHAVVHMSADAKEWKKTRLRQLGVEVVEHAGDFSAAVAAGREQASKRPSTYFVDDESSRELFLGYSVAASRLRKQLEATGVTVDAAHPLFVYLPCGVGGGPGGITFGLRNALGDDVHCFFVEPVASPCMLVRLGLGDSGAHSVYDVGLDNRTDADGLAVARASELAATLMQPLVSG